MPGRRPPLRTLAGLFTALAVAFTVAVTAAPASAAGPTAPFGNIDLLRRGSGGVSLGGWTIDPDTTGPIGVHVYANGAFVGATTANQPRPDVGFAFPGYGNNHGFALRLDLAEGPQEVCAFGINDGPGVNPLLGCGRVNVTSTPFGFLEAVTPVAGGVTVGGWAIDPNTADPIAIHVYANDVFVAAGTANLARGDVGLAFPGYGPNHGFNINVPLAPGRVRVCVFAINDRSGVNPRLGCRQL